MVSFQYKNIICLSLFAKEYTKKANMLKTHIYKLYLKINYKNKIIN